MNGLNLNNVLDEIEYTVHSTQQMICRKGTKKEFDKRNESDGKQGIQQIPKWGGLMKICNTA